MRVNQERRRLPVKRRRAERRSLGRKVIEMSSFVLLVMSNNMSTDPLNPDSVEWLLLSFACFYVSPQRWLFRVRLWLWEVRSQRRVGDKRGAQWVRERREASKDQVGRWDQYSHLTSIDCLVLLAEWILFCVCRSSKKKDEAKQKSSKQQQQKKKRRRIKVQDSSSSNEKVLKMQSTR